MMTQWFGFAHENMSVKLQEAVDHMLRYHMWLWLEYYFIDIPNALQLWLLFALSHYSRIDTSLRKLWWHIHINVYSKRKATYTWKLFTYSMAIEDNEMKVWAWTMVHNAWNIWYRYWYLGKSFLPICIQLGAAQLQVSLAVIQCH